ncbi:MAG: hypothetical protein ACJA2M_003149 [Polaribacter sp.]
MLFNSKGKNLKDMRWGIVQGAFALDTGEKYSVEFNKTNRGLDFFVSFFINGRNKMNKILIQL